MGLIKRYAAFPCELIIRHKFGIEIQGIKTKIRGISDSRSTYGIVDLGESTGETSSAADVALEARRRVSPRLDDDDTVVVVGLDLHKEKVLEHILDANVTRRCVMSIVGLGGLGKTTLAKKVYRSSEISRHFDTNSWVSVSQDFRAIELLKNIIKEVVGIAKKELEENDEEDLKVKLHDFLKGKRYFIVLDDIWRRDVWEQIRAAFPDVKNGSRVLLTTRFMEVARSADPAGPHYQLPFLDDQESWELFVKKVFPAASEQDTKPSCPNDLEDIGRKIVKRCGGLPLALVVIGGLVSAKDPNPVLWMKVADTMDWEATEDGKQCLKILALSYNDLPSHYLKSCFLYIGRYPEDADIDAPDLVRLWSAEGFIPQSNKQTMEETAQAYLEELEQRSMIQVIEKDWKGSVGVLRIHDLSRDLCLKEAREDGFLNVYSTHHNGLGRDPNPLRLAVFNDTDVEDCCPPSNLRSLIGIDIELSSISRILHGLRLLRVLCLLSIKSIERLPEEIKDMIHLRYLDLRGCKNLKELPSSIGNLRNLQTLDVRYTSIERLPKELGKLQRLRHVYGSNASECPPIGGLTNLQTLQYVSGRGGWVEPDLAKPSSIRDLGVVGLTVSQQRSLLDSLGKLKHLSSLHLASVRRVPMLIEFITALSSDHVYLQKLHLIGQLSRRQLPNSNEFPPTLTVLILTFSELEQDPMTELGKLPNLTSLELGYHAFAGKEIVCTAGGFPRLQSLELFHLDELEQWSIEAGALLNLKSLLVLFCGNLPMLPEGLQHVTSLRKLMVQDDRQEFKRRLLEGVGEDWHKISHVRSINLR